MYFRFMSSKMAQMMMRPPAASVTRRLDYVVNFGHLQQWNLAQTEKNIAQVGLKNCQILSKHSKIAKDC